MTRLLLLLTLLLPLPALAAGLPAPPDEVYLANLTSPEVGRAIAAGKTTALLPTGGIEQNGPHMILGKHDVIVKWTAGRIAESLGDALVAPVLPFVPEGGIDPLTGHMAWPGTITLAPPLFEAVLESEARSLKAHGFRLICFLGDHGESQPSQQRVAEALSAEWAAAGVRVVSLGDYYSAANGQDAWLLAQGETPASLGRHAGIADTSELLALQPSGIRSSLAKPGGGSGSDGDPNRASIERGRILLEMKVAAAVAQVKKIRSTTYP